MKSFTSSAIRKIAQRPNANRFPLQSLKPQEVKSAKGVTLILWILLADLVTLLHLAFILFVVFGGLVVLRYPRIAWLHLPAVLWGAVVEIGGYICPLTPLENYLRRMGGVEGYSGDFIEEYLLPILYPAAMTRELQIALGLFVIAFNLFIYLVIRHRLKMKR